MRAEAARLKAVARRGRLADRAEPRAVGKDCKRRGRSADARDWPSISGRPRWTSSPSISRTTRRTRGSWGNRRMGRAQRNPSRASTSPAMGFASLYPSYKRSLLPQPLRRALLRKRLRPLDVILRGRHRLHRRDIRAVRPSPVPATPSSPRWIACLEARIDIGEFLADRLRPALGCRQRFAGRNHLVHKAEFEPLLGRDVARGEDHAHGALQPDLPRQPVHAAGQRGEADARLGQREGRILRRR